MSLVEHYLNKNRQEEYEFINENSPLQNRENKMMNMKAYIKDSLVDMHANCHTDKYGQVHKDNYTPGNLFRGQEKEVEEYLKTNHGVLHIHTYGGQFGTYKAYTVIDEEIYYACQNALHSNPNYLRNINSY